MNTQASMNKLVGGWSGRSLAVALAALLAPSAFAAESLEGVGELSLSGPERGSARAMAMQSAHVGVADGADSLQWNPAGLGGLKLAETGWHHLTGLEGTLGESLLVGFPAGAAGGVALSVDFIDQGEFERRDDVGTLTGSYSAGSIGGSVGWGRAVTPDILVGAALKGTRQTVAGNAYASFAGDVGALWTAMPPLRVGVAVANLGTSGSDSALPMSIRAGASYAIELGAANRLLAAAAAEVQPGGLTRISVGAEDTLFSLLAVRAGYRLNLAEQALGALAGLTAGAGIAYANLSLDYAYLPFGDLGDSQRVSLTYRRALGAAPPSHSEHGGAQ